MLSLNSSADSRLVRWHDESSACQRQAPVEAALQPFSLEADTSHVAVPHRAGSSCSRRTTLAAHEELVCGLAFSCLSPAGKVAYWHDHSTQVPAGCGDNAG